MLPSTKHLLFMDFADLNINSSFPGGYTKNKGETTIPLREAGPRVGNSILDDASIHTCLGQVAVAQIPGLMQGGTYVCMLPKQISHTVLRAMSQTKICRHLKA